MYVNALLVIIQSLTTPYNAKNCKIATQTVKYANLIVTYVYNVSNNIHFYSTKKHAKRPNAMNLAIVKMMVVNAMQEIYA